MPYLARQFLDRIAKGDDCFRIEQLPDGRIRLIPAPDEVLETGSNVDRSLLQLIEDRVVWLMNRTDAELIGGSFNYTFGTLNGLNVEGIWNKEEMRIEC